MNPLEKYLKEIKMIKSTGGAVDEKSFYPPLCNLMNEVGKKLKPKVFCHSEVKDTGAGNPDFGFYSENQLQDLEHGKPLTQLPERGVIEVKPIYDDAWITAEGKQVTKYWGHYGQILVTNYRDFVFIGKDESGNPKKLESFRLTDSEANFWSLTMQPRKSSEEKGERLIEYLHRIMLHSAIISDPEKVAWFLASYAKEAKARIDLAGDLPGLAAIRQGLEESLGMKFEGKDGEHFFRATLIQTLFYGIFSSWVIWSRDHSYQSKSQFKWHETIWNLHVPVISALFSQIATPKKLKPLGIDEVLDWSEMVLNRVDRARFFETFEQEHAVLYFYEPFLKSYDPDLRKELGIWYTPPEIVKYQVSRIDTVLREELNIDDGLADSNVYVLDPCCGTGAYLVEVLRKISDILKSKGGDALLAQQLKKAAMERVFGFEILPAPFVIAHLQLGLMLKNLNAPLSDAKNERVGVYLTNALTGWEPEKKPKDKLPFPELQDEHDAAEKVKCDVPILVILGNPPYNAFAGTSPEEEEGLVEEYKGIYYEEKTSNRGGPPKRVRRYKLNDPESKGGWGIKKFNLDELYVRFFRIAERRIVKGGIGIISYISNFSYLGDPSFVIMRERFLKEFDKLWFDCMNGDSRETGKKTPEGKPDPSVFSTEKNKQGIRVGTTVSLMVRKKDRHNKPQVRFRHFWGVDKRRELLDSIKAKDINTQYRISKPEKSNRYLLRPINVTENYYSWPLLKDICSKIPFVGVEECRGGALIDIDKDNLANRMKSYFDKSIDWNKLKKIEPKFANESSENNLHEKRSDILKKVKYNQNNLVKIVLTPFDVRWCYHCDTKPFWNRSRPELRKECWVGNSFLVSRFNVQAAKEGVPLYFTTSIIDKQAISRNPGAIAIRLMHEPSKRKKGDATTNMFVEHIANLSKKSREYLKCLNIKNPDANEEASLLWMHSLAIGYSPVYLSENKDSIRNDWPRIPLPDSKDILLSSAMLGKKIASLLDTESNVKTVTSGTIRQDLKCIGVITHVTSNSIDPTKGELDLTAGWGHFGKNNVVMPSTGKIVERSYTPKERDLIKQGVEKLGLTQKQAFELLGEATCDVYLNDIAYWSNIPLNVWNYYIGGYQVIKKWLSYREKEILGRGLKMEEVYEVMNIARRIAAIILLQPALDKNYKDVKKSTFKWPKNIT
ncbi:MAG: N-6 DNA methylase [Sedimentisphaerales bacterium]|nr:N-6 DNA methylase [Sedimentisphaerales bacterium]